MDSNDALLVIEYIDIINNRPVYFTSFSTDSIVSWTSLFLKIRSKAFIEMFRSYFNYVIDLKIEILK